MICLTCCIFFLSVRAKFSDAAPCIFKPKCFNCSNSLLPFRFIKMVPNVVTKLGHSLTYGNQETMHTTKKPFGQHGHTSCQSRLTHFDFASVLLHYIATYVTHSFLLPNISTFTFFLHSLQMINILRQMKKFIADFMTRLSHIMTHQSVGHCWVIVYVIIFDKSIFLFRVFFLKKNILMSLFFLH